MALKALIAQKGIVRTKDSVIAESNEARSAGCVVEYEFPAGVLVRGNEQQFAKLEKKGFRIKLLSDTNILVVGAYEINIEEKLPRLPKGLRVPKSRQKVWRHHLVQLIGPPTEEWIHEIEAQGLDVVEKISSYGLFVVGNAEDVSKLKKMPFVAWTGLFQPAYKVSARLLKMRGNVRVNIGFLVSGDIDLLYKQIEELNGRIILKGENVSGRFVSIIAELDASKLSKIANLQDVRWLDYHPESILLDERSCQIAAGDLNGNAAPNTGPNTGYANTLTDLGVNGNGITIAICDSGVDTHNNATMQADLAGRMAFFLDQTGGSITVDRNGHGTHVAGIAAGNGTSGDADPQGFVLGQGMAPNANFGSINAIAGGVAINLSAWVQNAVTNNSNVMNNSWGTASGGVALFNQGYTALCRTLDQLVRDPNTGTATLENLAIVFAAGNSGPNNSTIGEPSEAKNAIVVGNSLNFRPGEGDLDDIRGLRQSSSRGPAVDGRILPTIVAPGANIISVRPGPTVDSDPGTPGIQRPRTAYTDTGGTAHNNHYDNSGTSMAAPHVTGMCALLYEWWRNRTGGANPSAALLKALLVNGAVDIAGGPTRRLDAAGNQIPIANIPNNDQGWGRVNLENIMLQAPATNRGPKIISDQRHAFTANGQEYQIRVSPVDTARPMRITLVWADAPGAANANPALVNDLDLEVTEVSTSNVYRGNVFNNGFSTTGGAFDNLNNTECVYIQNPSGVYQVRVIASGLSMNARPPFDATPWQDFALVIDNAEVPSTTPVSVVPTIDRSGSMVTFGYENVTRISSKQFVDLMSVDDQVGVVSFGSTGAVEYPTGASPAVQTITGQPIRDAAKGEIDGMAFGGCTYMGDGILKARDLLNTATVAGAKAMVLLSDGYDNKGCDPANPSKPSALDAVALLPPNLPVYTCAMGPASDQTLLEQIASTTSGRYYYMPTIDDLFEIYNYIRGQVSGDSIIVNDSATASSSRLPAFVDAYATEVTFTVSWANPKLKFVSGNPGKPSEINVRLRDPRGRLLNSDYSYLRRIEGEGYVIFKLQEPIPGQWFVEVKTQENTHVRYTVGGFVRSPLKLADSLFPKHVVRGAPITIAAQVYNGKTPIKGFAATCNVKTIATSISDLMVKYASQLQKIVVSSRGDKMPQDMAKLATLRNKMLKETDIFATASSTVNLKSTSSDTLGRIGLGGLLSSGPTVTVPDVSVTTSPVVTVPGTVSPTVPSISVGTGVLVGQFRETKNLGSYNVIVTASGMCPILNTRFVRKDLVSVYVK